MGHRERACLDGYAARMMENVMAAIDSFTSDPNWASLDTLRTKLGFADTDLLRLAHVQTRLLQRLVWLRWPEAGTLNPPSSGVCALALAIRGWLRQVDVHAACYHYISRLKQTAAASAPRALSQRQRPNRQCAGCCHSRFVCYLIANAYWLSSSCAYAGIAREFIP